MKRSAATSSRVLEVPPEETHRYGVIDARRAGRPRSSRSRAWSRSRRQETRRPTSTLLGRYILQPEVMRALDAQEKGAGGEIQLTDAMARLIGTQPFHGYAFDGERHDCGDKTGFVIANLALGLDDPEAAPTSATCS